MALNLDKLIKAHQFRFNTEGLGELLCHNFSISVMREVEKWLTEEDKLESVKFARYLTTLLCQQASKETDKTNRINKDQAEILSESELAEFCRLFIKTNKYFIEDQHKSETIRNKNDEGVVDVSYKGHVSSELLKSEDESETDHLLRVVDVYIKQSNERTKKVFESAKKGIFSSATLGLLKENKRISDSLGTTLIHNKPLKLSEIPENPVFETNRHLASFGKELNEVAQLIKNMNDLGVQMALDSAATTARTKFWNNVMFGLGLITLGVTAIFSYLSYASSNESSSQLERLLAEQNSLLKTLEENQKSLIKNLSLLTHTLEKQAAQEKVQKKLLSDISEQITNITNQSSSQPSTTKTP